LNFWRDMGFLFIGMAIAFLLCVTLDKAVFTAVLAMVCGTIHFFEDDDIQ
jgi:hypothetical protein